MRECKRFQEFMLSDYLDNELDERERKELQAHLVLCSDCRLFAQEVREKISLPLQRAKREPVPEDLWPQIKKRIAEKPKVTAVLEKLLDLLSAPFLSRRLFPVMAGIAVVFLSVTLVFKAQEKRIARENEQVSYLVSLFDLSGSQETEASVQVSSTLEEYFL